MPTWHMLGRQNSGNGNLGVYYSTKDEAQIRKLQAKRTGESGSFC